MRMHGSVFPKMIVPLTVVTLWSTLITCISEFIYPLAVSTLLLTVLGFVVGLAISFRTSTAYERYTEGRKYWSQMIFVSQNLARTIWIHTAEREGELGKEDLLNKLYVRSLGCARLTRLTYDYRTALNLLNAYACSVKHRLRFEPGIDYPDLRERVEFLDTFAKAAELDIPAPSKAGKAKAIGEFLGVTFAGSNPRKRIKNSKKPLGNLSLEILNHISCYVHSIIDNETLKVGLYQNQASMYRVAPLLDKQANIFQSHRNRPAQRSPHRHGPRSSDSPAHRLLYRHLTNHLGLRNDVALSTVGRPPLDHDPWLYLRSLHHHRTCRNRRRNREPLRQRRQRSSPRGVLRGARARH
jgi:hypothetical protein